MFSTLKPLPADPILGLSAAYNLDSNPNKIDLGVGVYKDEDGHTPIMAAVKQAEQLRLDTETTKTYQSPAGDQEFDSAKTLSAFALGLLLFVLTLCLNVVALHIVKKYREQYE